MSEVSLKAGTHLGHYELLSLIGKGGMGEVYRAHDQKLKRDVALKVLPEQFARDPDRLARFRREATLLASLNHPNIAAIYGVEHESGKHFLVLELVQGEDLRDRIVREGPVPVEEALRICSQIAEALEHAHEKGIIHRDLKPANVKLTPEGKVKVLDFGLAKAFEAGTAEPPPDSNSPTLAPGSSPTLPGLILGTASYMSPEQARGKTTDKRTDIWALGCVLYELITGKQAFRGEDLTEILASVVKADPDWTTLPADTLPGTRVLLRRSLEKDATKRYRDAADVKIQIEETLSAPASARVVPPHPAWRRAAPWAAGALLSLVVGIAVWSLKPALIPIAQRPTHVAITLPPGDRLTAASYAPVALSPDGSHLVYVAIHNGVLQLFLRAMDTQDAKPLPGTESAESPFFSPDGQWIGFYAGGKLKKISIDGGIPITLCESGSNAGATWGTDDTIVFSPSNGSALLRVSAAGGTPKVLTTLDRARGEVGHRLPQFLPGNKFVLFTIWNGLKGWDLGEIAIVNLETGERHVVLRGGVSGRYTPTGHLTYYRAGSLLAVPFDLVRLQVTDNNPVSLLEGVKSASGVTSGEYSLSETGSLAYVPAGLRQFDQRLIWMNRKGTADPVPAPVRSYDTAVISPDGRRAALGIVSGTTEIWIFDLSRSTLTLLTTESGGSRFPLWSPDGARVAYKGARAGFRNVFWRAADVSGNEERLTQGEENQTPESWSPDGKWLIFSALSPATGYDIWKVPVGGERKAQPVLRTSFGEDSARVSPDGNWLAYRSDESGRLEIYVQPFSGPGGKWQVSTEGGSNPTWARNGRELFYTNGDKMMAVDIQTQPTISVSKPRLLFASQNLGYDVTPDGQRFLMIQAVEPEQPATQINVVLNWFEELKQKVPVK